MMDLDQVIRNMFPVLTASKSKGLETNPVSGTRYIVAKDGLWREISLPWVIVTHKIAHSDFPLPFGELEESVVLKTRTIPRELWRQLHNDALAAMPNEMAAALIWNEATDTWRYALRQSTKATPDSVHYLETPLGEGEHLVVDLHSHGVHPAFFSQEDDQDDAGAMKFSGVIGGLSSEKSSSVLRLNMAGKTWHAQLAATGEMEVSHHE